jgi:hypothetical protein
MAAVTSNIVVNWQGEFFTIGDWIFTYVPCIQDITLFLIHGVNYASAAIRSRALADCFPCLRWKSSVSKIWR